MLNNLFTIEQGLAANDISFASRHPDIKDMAKGWAIRVRLGASGAIDGIEIVEEAGRGRLWTLRDGQHNGFPGLKTADGLLVLDGDARTFHAGNWNADKSSTARRTELLRLLGEAPVERPNESWPNAGHRKRIAERLEALRPLADDALAAAVPAAFERFLKAIEASPPFLVQLANALAERVRSGGDEWLEKAQAAFTGPVPLAIDVAEDDFDRDAGDPRQVAAISAALGGVAGTGSVESGGDLWCALSGRSAKLHAGSFPQPNLPGLGQSYIYARNRDIPSLTRYGRTADAAFPIDSGLVLRLSGIFDVLTSPDAKGRSWRLVPAETGDKPDLLIVSLPAAAGEPVTDALAEGGQDDDGEDQRVTGKTRLFELASRVIEHSKGRDAQGRAQSEMTVLVLRTVDPANRKAIYHRQASAADLFKAAERWQKAISNVPDWIGFPLPAKGEAQLSLRRPPPVGPLSITPLSRMQFANGGRRRVDVIGATTASAFGLFLREGDAERRARGLLGLLVKRHGPLLAGLAAARAKSIDHLKKFDPRTDLRRDALRSITWIGALLHHLDRPKEAYMSDAAFRLGQLLAGADTLHIGYCADLRGGDVPPSLIGNSVLTIAGARPQRALAILASRMKPYLAWAKREERLLGKIRDMRVKDPKTDEQRKAVRLSWAISNGLHSAPRLKELVSELEKVVPEQQAKDAFKAELLLGYLAGLKPLPKKNNPTDPSGDGDVDQNGGTSE